MGSVEVFQAKGVTEFGSNHSEEDLPEVLLYSNSYTAPITMAIVMLVQAVLNSDLQFLTSLEDTGHRRRSGFPKNCGVGPRISSGSWALCG